MKIATLAFVALGAVVHAQGQALQFKEVPGQKLFTGQMLVRPKQVRQLVRERVSLNSLDTIRSRAVRRLRPTIVRYLPKLDLYVVKVPAGRNESRYATELMRTGDYEYAHPNWRLMPVTEPNDPEYRNQWHHPVIQSELAWSLWTGDPTFVTAIADTGFQTNHPDLQDLLLPGYNSEDRLTQAQGGSIEDINGHGTHVAGCASAEGNNSVGVAGVAWNHQILPIKVSNSPGGGASFDAMLDGIMWAADNGGNTINLSYSGVSDPSAGVVGTYCKDRGALLFWAAGNSGDDWSGFSYPDTVVVGATGPGDQVAGFSCFGRGVAIYAPGVNILSSVMGSGYGGASGTSMASPVASGVAALAWSANMDLSAEDLQQILYDNTDPLNSPRVQNYGRVNAFKAVGAALATSPLDVPVINVVAQAGNVISGGVPDVDSPNLADSMIFLSQNQRGTGQVTGSDVLFRLPNFSNGAFDNGSVVTRLTIRVQARASLSGVTGLLYAKNLQGAWVLVDASPIPTGDFSDWQVRIPDVDSYLRPDGRVEILVRSVRPTRLGSAPYRVDLGYAELNVARRRLPPTP